MIDTAQTVTIDADIESMWTFVRDIHRWASLMPGMQECEVIDEDHSRWTLKVGVGALVRTVRVKVHVDQWQAPRHVAFSYRLEGDPVLGRGAYHATAKGAGRTEVLLQVRVEGSGPLAPMWEAMSRPLLPKLAGAFAQELKGTIEAAAEAAPPRPAPPATPPSWMAALGAWFRGVRRALFARTYGKSI